MASKKKDTGPRVAQFLPQDAQSLYTHCNASWTAVKGDPAHFTNPYPPAAEVEGDLAALNTALLAAAGKDPVAIAALGVAVGKVRGTFRRLGGYVESVLRAGAAEDAPAILSNVLMYQSNVGQRSPKPELEAKQGAVSGLVRLIALAVPSAALYFWEYSVDQVAWSAGAQSAQAHASVAGLTPGKVYYFRFRVFKRDGTTTSDSQVVRLMVL